MKVVQPVLQAQAMKRLWYSMSHPIHFRAIRNCFTHRNDSFLGTVNLISSNRNHRKQTTDIKSLVMDTSAQHFAKIRYMPAFVDKSTLIEAVLEKESRILLIAPRRFGKTINLSMLKTFFELLPDEEIMARNRELFAGLLIEKHETIMKHHQGMYPIIFLDFKSEDIVSSLDEALHKVSLVVRNIYQQHKYLVSSGELQGYQKREIEEWCQRNFEKNPVKTNEVIFDALTNLAKYLFEHFKKEIMVLADECDSICADAVVYMKDEQEIRKVVALCSGALSCLLKSSDEDVKIARGILTGISYHMTLGLSKLNNVKSYRFQENHEFYQYYGLTEEELDALLKKFDRTTDFNRLLKYYNGYRYNMLSTWSVMNYLNDNKIDNYWKESGTILQLSNAFRSLKVRSIFLELLSGSSQTIQFNLYRKIDYNHLRMLLATLVEGEFTFQNVDVFCNLLLEQGYLSVVDIRNTEDKVIKVEAKIPNREIRFEFREKLTSFYQEVYRIDFNLLQSCSSIFDKFGSSTNDNKQHILELFEMLNVFFKSIKFDILNETTFHHIMFLIALYCKGTCFSGIYCLPMVNQTIPDVVMFHNSIGFILKCKIGQVEHKVHKDIQNAEFGLYQILEKNYFDVFTNKKYNMDVQYHVFMGIHIKPEEKSISLSALLNSKNFSERINCET